MPNTKSLCATDYYTLQKESPCIVGGAAVCGIDAKVFCAGVQDAPGNKNSTVKMPFSYTADMVPATVTSPTGTIKTVNGFLHNNRWPLLFLVLIVLGILIFLYFKIKRKSV
ncbi:hypothetical protein SDC9_212967 [bioreactor metagenome]|uniref:Uncharacterized protein n=1 Tax=bioreactor metagenome TaxID=1076179 RepID=A0A645JNF1_9ZZZZ